MEEDANDSLKLWITKTDTDIKMSSLSISIDCPDFILLLCLIYYSIETFCKLRYFV